MNSAWMLSSVLVSLLIGTAALCVERVLMLRRGTPVRWVWIAAIAVSIAWSVRWLLPVPAIVETPQAALSIASELPDLVVMSSAAREATQSAPEVASTIDWTATLAIKPVAPLSESAESRVQLVWLGMSAALVVVLVWSHVRLARERRRWRATSLLGSDVLVSNGFGPAIVGMRRPSIVVPPWVLQVDASQQRTILLHEDEHRRARDQWLLIASFGALALAPWNLVLWLMRRRLTRAIELDCDERVLAHGVADVDYANVLLNAWQLARGAMPWAPTPALTEHVSRIGRRVEHLMRPAPQGILMKTIGGAFTSVVVMGAAVFVPAPEQAQSRPAPPPPPAQVLPIPSPLPALVTHDPQRGARLLVVGPWDATTAPLVKAIQERLALDVRLQPLSVISQAQVVAHLSAFAPNASLALRDAKASGTWVRASLVIAVRAQPSEKGFHIEAAVVGEGNAPPRRILDGDGSAAGIADALTRALYAVPSAIWFRQRQSDTTRAARVRFYLDSAGRVGESRRQPAAATSTTGAGSDSAATPLPAIEKAQVPPVPPPADAPAVVTRAPQQSARLLVVAPWDSTSDPLVKAIHERLAEDLRGKMVYVIPHAEFVRHASASGFSSNTLLTPSEIKALGNLVGADLVVAVSKVRHVDGGFRVFVSTVGVGDASPLRILEGEGSAWGISLSLIRALHADPAYSRLLQSQSDPASAAPARAAFTPAFTFSFRLRPDSNSRKTPITVDTTSRPFSFRFLSAANTWKTRFILDSTRRQFSFRFTPFANQWFMRFDTTGRVGRSSRPPLG